MIPSVKTLRRLFRPEDQRKAATLRRLLDGRLNPTVKGVEFVMGHRPERRLEAIMEAADELIGGHGSEAIECPGHHGGFYQNLHASYVNMGDTYVLTLILDHENEKFLVMSWGDYLEHEEAQSPCWKDNG